MIDRDQARLLCAPGQAVVGVLHASRTGRHQNLDTKLFPRSHLDPPLPPGRQKHVFVGDGGHITLG